MKNIILDNYKEELEKLDLVFIPYKNGFVYNGGFAFDIETTSVKIGEETLGFMYCWQVSIKDKIFMGRDWEQFKTFLKELKEIHKDKNFIIYVHNLSYEFQFLCKWFEWESIFASQERKVMYALTKDGIEFRCSYLLSGFSLSKVADNLLNHKIKKLTGDLDYSLIRHNKTELTEKELEYCVNDVLIIQYYIDEQITQFGTIKDIPLTNTGRVRKLCKEKLVYKNSKDGKKYLNKRYLNNLKKQYLEDDEYLLLKRAFQGGFTHANAIHVGDIINNVASFDFTSSYPAVMCSEYFPSSKGVLVDVNTVKDFENYINNKLCVFDITFKNLREKDEVFENPLSFSKCSVKGEYKINNGRLVCGDLVTTTITNIDFSVLKGFYDWDCFGVKNFYIYEKSYLPKEFIEIILDLYEKKTTLKGVEGKEEEYQNAKGLLNSLYGMCVTDIDRDEITFIEEWETKEGNLTDNINEYNNKWDRYLSYVWGVFITSYARRNLFTAIKIIGKDFIYADTDSVKILNYKDYEEKYFKIYNEQIILKLKNMCDKYNFNYSRIQPKTVKGVKKPLGVWDFEGVYNTFKTLGAKRYLTEKNGKFEITIAGLGKKQGLESMLKQAENKNVSVFDIFNDNMKIEKGETGKMTHHYIDYEIKGVIKDYNGIEGNYNEKSYIYLEDAEYSLSLAQSFKDFLNGLKVV